MNRESIPHFARLVSKNTIIQNGYNLNIPRYVEAEDKIPIDLHATVFGGIPNYEIDHLREYWGAFPSLRDEIFSRVNEHTSILSCTSIKETIRANGDILAFEGAYTDAFRPNRSSP